MCMFSAPSVPSAPPPGPDPKEAEAAAQRERLRAINAKGRASTILTSGEGVTEAAPTNKPALKALLG